MRKLLFIVTLVFAVALIGAAVYAYRHQRRPASGRTMTNVTNITSNASNVPTPGSLKFGIFTDTPDLTTAEQRLQAKVNIMAWFAHWQDHLANNKLAYACKQGYVPLITWESWDGQKQQRSYPLAAIAKGTYDAQIKQQLQAVADTCKGQTVIIRFDHEMDTPAGTVGWYPWQGDPATYVAAWRHLVAVSRSIDPAIKWLWSPNRGTPTAVLYYPGDQYVDYVGLTLNKGTLEPSERSFAQFYGENQMVIESFGKPVLIGETTYGERTGDKAAWIAGMFAYAKRNTNIVGLVWFNGSADYSYDSSVTALKAFQKGLE